jgi:hypothetical protein
MNLKSTWRKPADHGLEHAGGVRPPAQLPTCTTQPLKGEHPMNPNTATEYRDLPLAVLTESATNPRRIFEDAAHKLSPCSVISPTDEDKEGTRSTL